MLRIDVSKQQQSSIGVRHPQYEQAVMPLAMVYLHQIRARLDTMPEREGRQHLAAACLPLSAPRLDLTVLPIWIFSPLGFLYSIGALYAPTQSSSKRRQFTPRTRSVQDGVTITALVRVLVGVGVTSP